MKNNKTSDFKSKKKQLKREFFQSLFIIGVVVIVMWIATIAWFTNNTTVTAGMIELFSSYTAPFEICKVKNGVQEDKTSLDNTTIQWKLQAYIDEEQKKEFIGPGSSGKVVFDIVDFDTTLEDVQFVLDLSAIEVDGNTMVEETKQNLLEGHLLLFLQDDTSYDFKNRIRPNTGEPITIKLNYNDHHNGYKRITIQWIWTNIFPNLIRCEQELGDLFCNTISDSNQIDKRDQFLEYINGGNNKERFKQFFYDEGNQFMSTLDNIQKYEEYDTYDERKELRTLEEYFNNADQYIGESINKLEIQIRVIE